MPRSTTKTRHTPRRSGVGARLVLRPKNHARPHHRPKAMEHPWAYPLACLRSGINPETGQPLAAS